MNWENEGGTVWIPATKEQIYEMNKRKVAIELGITCSGFDTKTMEEDRMLGRDEKLPTVIRLAGVVLDSWRQNVPDGR